MNIETSEHCDRALALHARSTGKSNFTAIELHEVFGSETTADGMEQIRLLVDRGRLMMQAIYVDMDGSLHEMDTDTYAAAIEGNGFTDPLSGTRIEGCIELSPFWAYVAEEAPEA